MYASLTVACDAHTAESRRTLQSYNQCTDVLLCRRTCDGHAAFGPTVAVLVAAWARGVRSQTAGASGQICSVQRQQRPGVVRGSTTIRAAQAPTMRGMQTVAACDRRTFNLRHSWRTPGSISNVQTAIPCYLNNVLSSHPSGPHPNGGASHCDSQPGPSHQQRGGSLALPNFQDSLAEAELLHKKHTPGHTKLHQRWGSVETRRQQGHARDAEQRKRKCGNPRARQETQGIEI
jgi:hypothetical protein